MTPKPVTVYTYAACSRCRDATQWLRSHNIEFVERPIRETPPSVEELRRMLVCQNGKLLRLFNTSGLEYRALKLSEKFPTMNEAEALTLLAGNGRLVKRPFVVGERFGLVGFNETAWTAAFGQ
jgi:arsenate reductase